jgi:transposase
MARKTYSEEFRRQAVELYESTPGATVRGIADDLGVVRGTLTTWLRELGTGKKTDAQGARVDSPVRASSSAARWDDACADETADQELCRLRARVRELEINERKLLTEREILRSAAKYFAGETRW